MNTHILLLIHRDIPSAARPPIQRIAFAAVHVTEGNRRALEVASTVSRSLLSTVKLFAERLEVNAIASLQKHYKLNKGTHTYHQGKLTDDLRYVHLSTCTFRAVLSFGFYV